ncbi:MAG TPA: amidohydrolase family protein, partial [Gammaproteobacteria bacterium]|nr:amidohydrolase family protein [Gammaproteobacteria bacterium]
MSAQQIDTIINARWVIPVEPEGAVWEHHSVAIDNGRIVAVAPRADIDERYRAAATVTLDDHALIPGLVNAHTHSPMTLFRGLADDLPLMTWLNDHIWPAEGTWVSPEFVQDGSRHAIAEMLRSGTTCF